MPTPRSIQRTYLLLLFGNTLAASLIWGINTIFLLDAGLSNLEAFAANAFFTAGMVLFEVPTGIVADTAGRRLSYLLGTVTLSASTLLYVLLWQVEAPFWQWAVVSVLIGLGFTFFSGAVEAWLVDALTATGFTGSIESVFGRGQVASGTAMLGGSVAGGFIAQQTSLAVPFVLRGLVLVVMFVLALQAHARRRVHSGEGRRGAGRGPEDRVRVDRVRLARARSQVADGRGAGHGRRRHLRLLCAAALSPGALRGPGGLPGRRARGGHRRRRSDPGGLAAPRIRGRFGRRTSALIVIAVLNVVTLGLIGLIENFWAVIGLIAVWGLLFAAAMPIRQAYLNGLIPSRQRATILSFDSLMGSSGGVWTQPVLGRAADVWGYAPSYLLGAGISALAVPFLALSRRENAPADSLDLADLQVAPQQA